MFRVDPRREGHPLAPVAALDDALNLGDDLAYVAGPEVHLTMIDSHPRSVACTAALPTRGQREVSSSPMTSLSERFAAWMAEHDSENPGTPAATVLALRDSDTGPEILMVQRNAKGSFASNWVFPGGKVDPEDFANDPGDIVAASRRAACREALEEADLVVDETTLIPFSHWMPPTVVPRRFSTWFYATAAPAGVDGDVTIDGGEIVDHLWVTPTEALLKHAAGEVELVPPTWVTLRHLSAFASTGAALAAIAEREPPFYLTKMVRKDPPTVMWHGDAGYDSGDLDAAGPRHRLAMIPGDWRFEEPS